MAESVTREQMAAFEAKVMEQFTISEVALKAATDASLAA